MRLDIPSDATLVIFDLDCTLYKRGPLTAYFILWNLFSLKYLAAERHTRETLRGKDFVTGEMFYEAFFREMSSWSHKSAASCRKWYFDKYLPRMVRILHKHYTLAPWVEQTMTQLDARGTRVAILSDYDHVVEKLLALGFDMSWANAGLYVAPELGGLKPCREVFLRLLRSVGTEPSDTIYMIGDREDTDMAGARNVGIRGILVKN